VNKHIAPIDAPRYRHVTGSDGTWVLVWGMPVGGCMVSYAPSDRPPGCGPLQIFV